VAPANQPLASAGNGTLPSAEPRKIKTLSVRGDQADGAAAPVTAAAPPGAKPAPAAKTTATATPAPAAPRSPPSAANASANGPLSLTPQATPPAPTADTRTHVAGVAPTNPVQAAPSGGGGGGYLVQVSSQKNEADAQSSFRALQSKFPAVLGSRAPVIKRADLGDKGVYYRAMVGPFGSPDEASQFCGSLKTAGGQCVVQRN
jgi:cell division protein FtsN